MPQDSKVPTVLKTRPGNRAILRLGRTMRSPLLALPLSLFLVTACKRTPEEPAGSRAEPQAPASATPAPPAPAAPVAPGASAREITWTDPAGWQKVPSGSPMRKATYKVPAAPKDPEDGELAVFYFRGEGGSTEANIQRWIGQFPDAKPADAKRSQRNVSGMNQTIVEVEGTYSGGGMPGGPAATPKPQYRLIGAVVETPAGPYFFKLTGPKKTVEAAKSTFFTLLDSVKSS
jgi:hypothetical protein